MSLLSELDRPFRLIAFDWDGTAVPSRHADASRAVGLIDRLLGAGARIAIVTGTSFDNVAAQLDAGIRPDHAARLYVSTNRGSEVFGFDRRGRACLLHRRIATAREDEQLDQIADGVQRVLTRLTGLPIGVVRDRLNRRKIDLIPEPAWRDPPKSAIGELLAATEARLRGAGVRNGLREAFELTEQLARAVGLEGARVTSDVKHLEVGLTDKADAMEWIFAAVAAPLGIAPGDVLLIGDEFGPIAGFEGSDHRMLAVSVARGAVVVSVGLEPGGAPPRVLHVGGGPERFCEVLEQQLAIEAQRGIFAPQRDAAWSIDEPGFDVAREHEIESLMAISNGFVGSRGSIAEGSSVSRPATFLAGSFEPSSDLTSVPELLIVPSSGRLRFTIEGEPFSVESSELLDHRRVLDLRRGLLLREATCRTPGGHVTCIRTVQAVSSADRHLFLEGVELLPLNFTGTIRVEAILSGDVRSGSGSLHWADFQVESGPRGSTLIGRTKSGLVATLASHVEVEGAVERAIGASWASESCRLAVRVAERREVYRTVALFTSRESSEPTAAALDRRAEVGGRPVAELVERHAEAWAERWRRADVVIHGAPGLERALRFALYHLLAAANPTDPRSSIGARALSGEAYRGHVFWDTEIFMLPFYVYGWPEAARALLGYRHVTLDGARRKARALGYEGALYAWESTDTGDETTPSLVRSPFGEVVRVLSGELEHHISADVAYALAAYARATGDDALLQGRGLEILVETARFWASRARRGDDGLFHIDRVIGPDEYHEEVDDNAFTNWMARFTLRAAADAAAAAGAERFGASLAELARFRDVAAAMYLGQPDPDGVIEQFAGFHRLEPIDLTAFGPRHPPIDMVLGRARTQASQVVKQADVVQLVALLWDELTPAARLANFLHYEPRTAHGSSLSPGAHALVAARLGLNAVAERYLAQAAEIDLGDTMGNAAGGVHAAAMGSLWQAVVLGAGGVRPAADHPEALVLEPRLLPGWRHLGFPLAYRGRSLDVLVEPGAIEIAIEGSARLPIRAGAEGAPSREVLAEPGRRYATRRGAAGFEAWEEIRS